MNEHLGERTVPQTKQNTFWKLIARNKRIIIEGIECDEISFSDHREHEDYEKMFQFAGNIGHKSLDRVVDLARGIVTNDKDVRVFAIDVAANGDIMVCATRKSTPDEAFSYLVRRDCKSQFDAFYTKDDGVMYKYHFYQSYRFTRITAYEVDDHGEWTVRQEATIEPNGNSRLIEFHDLPKAAA